VTKKTPYVYSTGVDKGTKWNHQKFGGMKKSWWKGRKCSFAGRGAEFSGHGSVGGGLGKGWLFGVCGGGWEKHRRGTWRKNLLIWQSQKKILAGRPARSKGERCSKLEVGRGKRNSQIPRKRLKRGGRALESKSVPPGSLLTGLPNWKIFQPRDLRASSVRGTTSEGGLRPLTLLLSSLALLQGGGKIGSLQTWAMSKYFKKS